MNARIHRARTPVQTPVSKEQAGKKALAQSAQTSRNKCVAMIPPIEPRVRAHIFVAALALLVQRLLDRRLQEAGIEFSSTRAMEALCTVRHVTFRVQGQAKRCGVAGGCSDARRVLKALKVKDLRPPTLPPGDMADTVM